MIDKDTSWDQALRQLAVLPEPYQKTHGDVNYMCAGRFRRNARKLFEEAIAPLLSSEDVYEVVFGFVEGRLAVELDLPEGHSEFKRASLRSRQTGETIEVSIN